MPASTAVQRITIALLLTCVSARASAEEAQKEKASGSAIDDSARTNAAKVFEQGVRQFEAKDYANAAHTFLDADAAAANTRALTNALTAARRAGLPLLVIESVRRSKTRGDLDPDARKLFDGAMADAARQVAHVEARCEPAPCTVAIDGKVGDADVYLLPGEHTILGEGTGGRAEQRFRCNAGETCPLALRLVPEEPAPEPQPLAPPPVPSTPESPPSAAERPLPPWVFITGATVTAGLVAITIWSGVDALSARDKHPPSSPAYDPDDIESRAHRTDILLASAVVVGGATAVAGLFFVNFDKETRASVSALPGGGAVFSAVGRF